MLSSLRLLSPSTVAEAGSELRRLGDAAKVYAGGAELLLLMRHGLVEADYLVDVKGIPELGAITPNGASLRIGATVSHRRLETDPLIRQRLPMLADAEAHVGNIRVRCQGTLGGNLCFADPHADPPTALLVYGASVTLGGRDGTRSLPLDKFLVGTYDTAIDADELLTAVDVPLLPPGWGAGFRRVERFYRPTANVAVAAKVEDGYIGDVRLGVGCVGPKAMRLPELEERLRGLTRADAQEAIAASKAYLAEKLEPVGDLLGSAEYKVAVTAVLLQRALEDAAEEGSRRQAGGGAEGPDRAQGDVVPAEGVSQIRSPRTATPDALDITVEINSQDWSGAVAVEETLLDFVRGRLALTGTKRGCESEVCGACTVLVDGDPISSCTYLAFEVDGRAVTTIEGLAVAERLHPLQEAFVRNVAAQCGYCTPGQLMAAAALLEVNPSPTYEQMAHWLTGNICRCGCYPSIAASIREAAEELGAKVRSS